MDDTKTLPPEEELKETQEEEEEDTSSEESEEESKETPEGESEEETEETITLKKSEHEKLVSDLENYRKATIALKRKPQPKGDFVTRQELNKSTEDKAVKAVTISKKDDSDEEKSLKGEMADNWNAIMDYLPRKFDRTDSIAIEKALRTAHRLWKEENQEEEDTSKEDTSNLASTKTKGGSSPKKGKEAPKKSFIKDIGTPVDKWYPKQE